MSDWGLKISLPGHDAKTATPEQCALHSEYPIMKIRTDKTPAHFGVYTHQVVSDPPNGVHNWLTIPHGYSYTPVAIVFVEREVFSGVFFILPYFTWTCIGDDQYLCAYTDGTNLKIDYVVANNGNFCHANIAGEIFNFKYYLFVDNGV